jgi:hypothetical protein
MAIEEHLPLLDEILDKWKDDIGNDYAGYRNHVCRMINFCFALHNCNPDEREKADRYADQQGIDRFANGLGEVTQWLSATVRKVQNGFVRSYALSVLLGVVLILGYLILK